jgi:hypothetical protein
LKEISKPCEAESHICEPLTLRTLKTAEIERLQQWIKANREQMCAQTEENKIVIDKFHPSFRTLDR